MDDIGDLVHSLDEKYPLVPHGVGMLYSTVRRMKAEKELRIPINRRTGFAISAKHGKPANQLNEAAWEEFYLDLRSQLKRDYPELYGELFQVEWERDNAGVYRIKVNAATLWQNRSVSSAVNIPGIIGLEVCLGSGGWPTPHEVGIYIESDNELCCIIDWPRPCSPVRFSCRYGAFLVYLDTAAETEILSANEVEAHFYHDD